jgi:hypothetical protein
LDLLKLIQRKQATRVNVGFICVRVRFSRRGGGGIDTATNINRLSSHSWFRASSFIN